MRGGGHLEGRGPERRDARRRTPRREDGRGRQRGAHGKEARRGDQLQRELHGVARHLRHIWVRFNVRVGKRLE
jgi:hypothetical protein